MQRVNSLSRLGMVKYSEEVFPPWDHSLLPLHQIIIGGKRRKDWPHGGKKNMSAKVASGEEQTLNASSVAAIRRGCLRVWSRSEGESLAALTLERMRGLEKGAPPSTDYYGDWSL